MPIQHSTPERQKRTQAALTPTPTAPLDGTPTVPQLRAQLDRGPHMEGAAPSRKEGRGPRRSNSFSGVVGGFTGAPRTFLRVQVKMQMTQIMANLQADSSSESSRPPAFKTPSMKAPERSDGTQTFKVRSFIQSCQFIFHDDPANVSQDRKQVLYATTFLICRAVKWIAPYHSNLSNQDSNYLLNSWNLFEYQLFTLFGDPNEVRKAEAELDSPRMKEGGHVSLYIAYL
ncbi:hypothetical protein O181_006282 [Austropuccinia psidii MF-1]|uniref:DUF4939 domain-containing protein n=1 Tax=Austropuccinia psidii MF-1 TaxID=1389203 RepID=A0A9Q3BJS2_9BASI|nr:hypothetical protein [Austropuccinia psidii MF-1]